MFLWQFFNADSSTNIDPPFSQDIEIQAGATLSWPIWFHAATPGNVSLYISLYYEMESSSDIKYRTLRMHYDLEVTDCAPIFHLFEDAMFVIP